MGQWRRSGLRDRQGQWDRLDPVHLLVLRDPVRPSVRLGQQDRWGRLHQSRPQGLRGLVHRLLRRGQLDRSRRLDRRVRLHRRGLLDRWDLARRWLQRGLLVRLHPSLRRGLANPVLQRALVNQRALEHRLRPSVQRDRLVPEARWDQQGLQAPGHLAGLQYSN